MKVRSISKSSRFMPNFLLRFPIEIILKLPIATMPKVNFSEQDILLLQNTEWLYRKRKIVDDIKIEFSCCTEKIIAHEAFNRLTSDIGLGKMKITSGENLNGLPWVISDINAIFEKENVFTLRLLFWWGNYFSTNLIMAGSLYKDILPSKHLENIFVTNSIWENDLSRYSINPNSNSILKTRMSKRVDLFKINSVTEELVKESIDLVQLIY